MKREELINRLKPFAQGCFSGQCVEWPQLKPLLQDIYNFLCEDAVLTNAAPDSEGSAVLEGNVYNIEYVELDKIVLTRCP